MFKFLYTLSAWLLTHYDDMPPAFKEKFPKEVIRDFTLIVSNISVNSSVFKDYGYE